MPKDRKNVIVRCNECMYMMPAEEEGQPNILRCPNCHGGHALMDMSIEDIIFQNNARYKTVSPDPDANKG